MITEEQLRTREIAAHKRKSEIYTIMQAGHLPDAKSCGEALTRQSDAVIKLVAEIRRMRQAETQRIANEQVPEVQQGSG